jgi:hypothetical protein
MSKPSFIGPPMPRTVKAPKAPKMKEFKRDRVNRFWTDWQIGQ